MNRLLITAGLALAATAVHAQEGPYPSAPPTSQQEAQAANTVSGHSTTVYHGPHRYPLKERSKTPGNPPIIDHSMDSAIVEPTHSTITITVPVASTP